MDIETTGTLAQVRSNVRPAAKTNYSTGCQAGRKTDLRDEITDGRPAIILNRAASTFLNVGQPPARFLPPVPLKVVAEIGRLFSRTRSAAFQQSWKAPAHKDAVQACAQVVAAKRALRLPADPSFVEFLF